MKHLPLFPTDSHRTQGLFLCLFLLGIYILTSPGHFTTSMDISAHKVAKSVIEDGDFALTKNEAKTHEMRLGKDGSYYCFMSLGSVLIPVPFVILSKLFSVTSAKLVLMTNVILTALAALIIMLIGLELKYSRKTAFLLAIMYGLGTMAWAHTRYLMPDPLASLVYLTVFLFFIKYRESRTRYHAFMTGLFTGIAFLSRPDAILFVAVISLGIGVLLFREWKAEMRPLSQVATKMVVFLVPLLVSLSLWGYYNYFRFENILETGYTMSKVVEGDGTATEKLGALSYLKRFLVIGKTLKGFWGMWIVPNRSIFFINPVLIFFLFSVKPFWKKYRFEMILIGIALVFYTFLYSNRGPTGFAGSAAWGQRYILPMIGFMVLPIGLYLERILLSKRRILVAVFFGFFILSIGIQFIGTTQNYQNFQIPLEKQFGSDQTRTMLFMVPKYSLLFLNAKLLSLGYTDFMFYSYLRSGTVPLWVVLSLACSVLTVLFSGYVLVTRIIFPPQEPVRPAGREKHQSSRRKKKRK